MRIILRHMRDGEIIEFKAYTIGAIEDINVVDLRKMEMSFDPKIYNDVFKSLYSKISDCKNCMNDLRTYLQGLVLENKGYSYVIAIHVRDFVAQSSDTFTVPLKKIESRTFSSLEELITRLDSACKSGIDLSIDESGKIEYKCFTEPKNSAFS